jgi:hypothetical protein
VPLVVLCREVTVLSHNARCMVLNRSHVTVVVVPTATRVSVPPAYEVALAPLREIG